MPGYDGKMTGAAALGFWKFPCANMEGVENIDRNGSLLAQNFNKLWVHTLNRVHRGERVDYFAMLHNDIGPEKFWLDKLIDELEERELDVLGVVVPIKDSRGMTSIALAGDDEPWVNPWVPHCKLSMLDVFQLPETFTSEDVGRPLLLNTGCWVAKWNQDWCRLVHFEIKDRIVFNTVSQRYEEQVQPEDWNFSRQLHEIGMPGTRTDGMRRLKIGATRKVSLLHRGDADFANWQPWGSDPHDKELLTHSPVPGAFPHDIKGWLTVEEGRKLADLAAGKRVLEIGSFCGRSTVCMARVAEHVTAVDFFNAVAVPFYGDYSDDFDRSMARHGVTEKVTKCRPESEISGEFDFAFIDGAHDYESVRKDIEKALAVLTPDGLIAFHDYRGGVDPGVDKAVDELLLEGGQMISVTKTLAVVKPPALIPLEV